MFVSLLEAVLRHAERAPEALAYCSLHDQVSYGDFARRITRAAIALHARGVVAGDCIALDIVDDRHAVPFLAAQYAIAWVGGRALSLYPDVPEHRRREVLDHFRPPWVITDRLDRAGALDLASLESVGGAAAPPPRCDTPERPYQYLFSSGTTGAPKAALFSAAQLAQLTRVTAVMNDLRPTDRVLPAKAWPSAVGMRWARRVLDCGATLCNLRFPRTWPEFVDLVATHRLTGASASPWQVRVWLADARDQPIAALRFLELAGAPTFPSEIAAIRRHITPNMMIIYGSNEAGIIGYLPAAAAADAPLQLAPGLAAQAFDEEGRGLPAGQAGRLGFRAPWIASGYANNPEANARQFREGWCFPGDYGTVDGAGGLVLQGRSDAAINQGGNKIIPEEVEALLLANPQVRDAAVVGVADALSGERAVACVVLRAGAKLDAVRIALAERISGYAMPTRLTALRAIPRNSNGKLDRNALRVILERKLRG
jgi:acyl-coenzyme A synthetase/AMP-(fatty) acid ligase